MLKFKKLLLVLLALTCSVAFGQTNESSQRPTNLKKWYWMNSSELIFSAGELKISNPTVDGFGLVNYGVDNVVRFSAFLHFQQQAHFNFSNNLGFYIGVGMRNIGFINTLSGLEKKIKIKQRSYSLGIPFAVKVGKMDGFYATIGAEAELMFAYKRKVFYDGNKSKKSQWFSDDINLFNPGMFAEVHFKRGSYIHVKYYLSDFLKSETENFVLPDDGRTISYKVNSSKLFYVGIGTSIKGKKAKRRNTSSAPAAV